MTSAVTEKLHPEDMFTANSFEDDSLSSLSEMMKYSLEISHGRTKRM